MLISRTVRLDNYSSTVDKYGIGMWNGKISILMMLFIGIKLIEAGNMVCFYDSSSFTRPGLAKFTLTDLEPALQFCNYLIYGYAGIDNETYRIKPLNNELDITQDHYRSITQIKRRYPQLRILLSVGGDHDEDGMEGAQSNKYLLLLEDPKRRQAFVESVAIVIQSYGFDGLDVAWQFPKNYPKEVVGGLKKAWRGFKSWFTGPKVVDEKSEDHKRYFTALMRELRTAFGYNGPILSLTMLPNVDSSLFVDVFTVSANIDFVNLAAFDFHTPERDPKIADHTAPLYEMYDRDPSHNVNFQVQYWLNQSAAASIINVGVAAYGRSWVMTRDSGITGYPPLPNTDGPATGGKQLNMPGILSWPETCEKLSNYRREPLGDKDDVDDSLKKVGDPTSRFGIYAYRAADGNGLNCLWVSYEDPTSAAVKATYVRSKGLGGIALFDLSMDDYRGQCAGEKYPILRSIKFKL